MFNLIVFFLLSIVFSFLCSIWEAVLLSITPKYIKEKVAEKSSIGTKLEEFKEEIDRPLSAILTLNTIAHTVGAIGVGASAGELYGNTQLDLGVLSISGETIIAVVMTLAILLLSEIIPKTLGANNWKALAPFTVKSLSILLLILKPLVWLSQMITKRFKKEKDKSVLRRADILALTVEGEVSGALDKGESKIIKNLLRFSTIKAKDVMTPRTVIEAAKNSHEVGEFYETFKPFSFSRIPLFDEDLDSVTGIVLKDQVLEEMISGNKTTKLANMQREVRFIDENTSINELFEDMTKNAEHIVMVTNNFGVTVGLVTMEDVVETLLGLEIMDESDQVADLQALARDKWTQRHSNKK